MNNTKKKQSALSREKWLEIAMDAMTGKCISKFSLDSMFKIVPVSKGSFYWHFKNRSEFLEALVEYWERTETENVIQALNALPQGTKAEEKLWEMMCVIYEFKSTRHELLVRSLALEFPKLSQVIESVDRKRYETVYEVFAEMGFKGDELEMRTDVFVTVMSMDQISTHLHHDEAYRRLLKTRHEFLIRK